MNIDVNNNRSLRKLVSLGSERVDYEVVRARTKEFTSEEREIDLIEKYYRLIVTTDYLRTEAHEFLVKGKTYKQIIEEYEVNQGYLRNIIYNETKRVFDDLQGDPLGDVRLGVCTEGKVIAYESRLDELLEKSNVRDGGEVTEIFSFDIEGKAKVDREFNRNVGEQDFKDLVDILKYFVKAYEGLVLENIDNRHIGYILHLLKTEESSLTDKDKKRKKYMEMEWMLG